jgi:pyruvate ferredoxin oxidoreductase alpha subunit
LNWKSKDELGQTIVEAAVNSCFFPLYEVDRGITTVTYDPEEKNKRINVSEWLKLMGKTKHLLKEGSQEMLQQFDQEVERRWRQLRAKHESPYL